MTILYSLALLFTVNGVQHSVSSKHFLTKDQCSSHGGVLRIDILSNPPFGFGQNNDEMVIVSSNPQYLCVPTSLGLPEE